MAQSQRHLRSVDEDFGELGALIAKGQQTHTWQDELLPLIKSNAQDVLKKNSLLVQEQYNIKLLVL